MADCKWCSEECEDDSEFCDHWCMLNYANQADIGPEERAKLQDKFDKWLEAQDAELEEAEAKCQKNG